MSDAFYADMAETAQELVAKFGAAGSIRRQGDPTGPDYDPTPGAIVDHPCTVAITKFSNREIDGQRILSTDRKALVAPGVGITPTTSDLLVTPDGDTLTIVNVEVLRPATTTVLFTLQVRA